MENAAYIVRNGNSDAHGDVYLSYDDIKITLYEARGYKQQQIADLFYQKRYKFVRKNQSKLNQNIGRSNSGGRVGWFVGHELFKGSGGNISLAITLRQNGEEMEL